MKTKQKLTVVGAGFSGLATAYFATKCGFTVTVLDPGGIGASTSAIAAGLVHPFTGPKAALNWRGHEGMQATSKLLAVSEAETGKPVASRTGILRLAITEKQQAHFKNSAYQNEDVFWLTNDEVAEKLPQITPYNGIFIPEGMAVNVRDYLLGLWSACQKLGVVLKKENAEQLADFDGFKVVASGFQSKELIPELALTPVKGQMLRLAWPENLIPLPHPINSRAYIVMEPDNKSCWVGATFERNFTNNHIDLHEAKKEILPHAARLIPQLADAEIIDCQVGIRASTPNRQPLSTQINQTTWTLTGMGSKGLLYHALLAEELVSTIAQGV